jgi:hypothetical protein
MGYWTKGNTVIDEGQGMIICLGPDAQGCGNVLQDSIMKCTSYVHDMDENPFELFSAQDSFRSELFSANSHARRLNNIVEANLNRYG